jgi:hypothetical protein
MTLSIRCDHVSPIFQRCDAELTGLAFNAKPANWTVIELGDGDHYDYCPDHAPTRGDGRQ